MFEESHGVGNTMIKQTHTFAAHFGCGCVGFDGLRISDFHPFSVLEGDRGIRDHFSVATDFRCCCSCTLYFKSNVFDMVKNNMEYIFSTISTKGQS